MARLKDFIHREVERAIIPASSFVNLSQNIGQAGAETIYRNRRLPLTKMVLGDLQADTFNPANHETAAAAATRVIVADDQSSYQSDVLRLADALVTSWAQEQVSTYDRGRQLARDITERADLDIATYVITKWAPTIAANIIPTTGINKDATVTKRSSAVAAGGYAGLVLAFAFQDLENMLVAIRKQGVVGGKWYALPSVEQWADIRLIDQVTDYQKTGLVDQLGRTILGSYGNVTFLDARQFDEWGSNILYDTTTPGAEVPIAYAGALSVAMVGAMLVWNESYVERSGTALKIFERMDDPDVLGDIRNAALRIGARQSRSDQKGVIAMIETPTI